MSHARVLTTSKIGVATYKKYASQIEAWRELRSTNNNAWYKFNRTCRWHAESAALRAVLSGTTMPKYTGGGTAQGKSVVPWKPAPKVKPEDKMRTLAKEPTGFPHMDNEALMKTAGVADFLTMLTYMRPAGCKPEDDYIKRFIDVVPGMNVDKFGNRWMIVGDRDHPKILWSSHTDTVHLKGGVQQVTLGDGFAYVEDSSCLGADDTCGNWLMLQMIAAQVPGLYIFHREEEIGGHGSSYIAKNNGLWLRDNWKVQAAIAFDRKGYDSVITHQFGGRCCSETFAKSLAKLLGGMFMSDDGGTFTDTANYTDYIGECTNLSVGYHGAHGPSECTNVGFLVHLRDALIAADWDQLVIERKPGEADPDDDWGGGRWGGYTGYGYGGTRSNWTKGGKAYGDEDRDLEDLIAYCKKYPMGVANFLLDQGITTADLDDHYMGEDADDEHMDGEVDDTDPSPWQH